MPLGRNCAIAALCLALLVGALPAAARRLALVIGNDSYQHVEALHNARADARAVAASLQSLGFTVTLKQDLALEPMKQALRTFKASVAGGDEVVFYFSGHGVQFGGSNYLIPVDLVPENEEEVADESVGLQRVLDDMSEQKARFSLAIIDACRDNPFKGTGRAIGKRGLASLQAATGQMVMYSAGAGQQALDRLGSRDSDPNGVFTRVLIREIRKPGVTASQLLKNVQGQVVELAQTVNHEQVPAVYDGSIGNYYFVPVGRTAAAAQTAAAATTIHVATPDELEQEYWDRIRDSTDPADFSDYAKQFPQGAHAAEAVLELRKLKRAAQKSAAPVARSANTATPAAPAVARAATLPAADVASAGQAATTSVAPGAYAGFTTDTRIVGRKVLGRLMLAGNGDFEYRTETGARILGTLDLSRPDSVSAEATVTVSNGSSTHLSIHGTLSEGKLRGQYMDGWGDHGDIVFDFSNPL